jgi:hypothetical protein
MTIASPGRNRPRLDRGELTADRWELRTDRWEPRLDRGGLDPVRKSERVPRGSSPACQSTPGARPSIYEHVRVFTRTRESVLSWVFRPSQ